MRALSVLCSIAILAACTSESTNTGVGGSGGAAAGSGGSGGAVAGAGGTSAGGSGGAVAGAGGTSAGGTAGTSAGGTAAMGGVGGAGGSAGAFTCQSVIDTCATNCLSKVKAITNPTVLACVSDAKCECDLGCRISGWCNSSGGCSPNTQADAAFDAVCAEQLTECGFIDPGCK